MDNEVVFRILFALIFVSYFGISIYFRRKADRAGDPVALKQEGWMALPLRLGGLIFLAMALLYVFYPRAVIWATLPLPEWARWVGAGLAALAVSSSYWVASSLGNNITSTVSTRQHAQLVTHGPYRYVRHPLYTVGLVVFVAMSLLAAIWYFILMGVLAFTLLAIRAGKEEAELIDRFGDDYRAYMRRAGRFFPRLF